MVGLFSWFYPGSVNPNLVALGVGFSGWFYWYAPTRSSGPERCLYPKRPTFQVHGTWATLSPLADVFSLLAMNCGLFQRTERASRIESGGSTGLATCAEMVSIRWTRIHVGRSHYSPGTVFGEILVCNLKNPQERSRSE